MLVWVGLSRYICQDIFVCLYMDKSLDIFVLNALGAGIIMKLKPRHSRYAFNFRLHAEGPFS